MTIIQSLFKVTNKWVCAILARLCKIKTTHFMSQIVYIITKGMQAVDKCFSMNHFIRKIKY